MIVRQEHNHPTGEEALQVEKAISNMRKEPVRRQHQSHKFMTKLNRVDLVNFISLLKFMYYKN